jgi:hypothetical protein
MFRTPKPFTPEKAHIFLENHHNICWSPYTMMSEDGLFHHKTTFLISIRRGMLPWRRGSFNSDAFIAEPYHPDRVARQFRFDQVVPFSPLESLYTTDEIGIAHSFWLHLLSVELEFQYFPNDTRVTDSSVAWAHWWKNFVRPFARISNSLSKGNMIGKTPYDERKKNKYALENHITARPLSTKDFQIVERVPHKQREQYISVIEKAEDRNKKRWMPILQRYLEDVIAVPHMHINKVS